MITREMKIILSVILAALLIIGMLSFLSSRIGVGKSRLGVIREGAHFPIVSGNNLMRIEYEFPRDFEGEYNLLFVPFQQWQQREVNTWIPAAQQLEQERKGLVYYELPTIYELPALSRTFINEGMRAGIPDQTARERTITLYLDKERFKKALAIDSEDAITVLLVDNEGTILWRESGAYTSDKIEELRNQLNNLE
jgi:hypothetical protein